jgi:hypothetical protein
VIYVAEKTFKVDIDEGVVDEFNAFTDAMGMKNKAIVERLLRFFNAQPDPIRRYMIGLVDGAEAGAIAEFADSLPRPPVAGSIKPTTSASGKRTESQNQAAKKFPRGGKS